MRGSILILRPPLSHLPIRARCPAALSSHKNADVHWKLVGRAAIYWLGMADVPTAQRLAAVREQLEPLAASVDVDALENRGGELEEEMGAPGFWDDQER